MKTDKLLRVVLAGALLALAPALLAAGCGSTGSSSGGASPSPSPAGEAAHHGAAGHRPGGADGLGAAGRRAAHPDVHRQRRGAVRGRGRPGSVRLRLRPRRAHGRAPRSHAAGQEHEGRARRRRQAGPRRDGGARPGRRQRVGRLREGAAGRGGPAEEVVVLRARDRQRRQPVHRRGRPVPRSLGRVLTRSRHPAAHGGQPQHGVRRGRRPGADRLLRGSRRPRSPSAWAARCR